MKITRMAIFDFDGTLVNTPLKPHDWKGGWWGKDVSLLPPYMPHCHELKEKGSHLLNKQVVKSYFENKSRPDTHVVMMTGRHWGLHKHVMNILHGFDLCIKEDLENLSQSSNRFVFISGENTLKGKLDRLTELFREFDEVDQIEMWEDREEHIPHFRSHKEILKTIRPHFKNLIVYEPPHWSECPVGESNRPSPAQVPVSFQGLTDANGTQSDIVG